MAERARHYGIIDTFAENARKLGLGDSPEDYTVGAKVPALSQDELNVKIVEPKNVVKAKGPELRAPTNVDAMKVKLDILRRTINILDDNRNYSEYGVITQLDGTVIQTLRGNQGKIPLEKHLDTIDKMQANSVILLHTHLKDISLSMEDIEKLWQHNAIREVWNTTPSGRMYRMYVKSRYRPSYKDFIKALNEASNEATEYGKKDLDDPAVRHKRNDLLTRKLGWGYCEYTGGVI
jgi:hypothetical protein